MALDRRTFLQRAGLLGVGAVGLSIGIPRPPARADESLATFLHGVASGDPLPDRVIIWTRLDGITGDAEVSWQLATDVDMADVVASGTAPAPASRDHTVKVDVEGLQPATYYYYEFAHNGIRSLIGRTKTAPDGPVDHLRFGVASCSNYEGGFFNAYAGLARRNDLDAVLHLGDYVYEYESGGYPEADPPLRAHEPPHEMTTLADYRLRYKSYKLDPDLRRLHQLFPFITTWDDHESTDNSWRDGAYNHNEGEGEWAERKAASQQAYEEMLPIRVGDPAVIYRRLRYGDLADLIVLDTRLERDQQVGLTEDGLVAVPGEVNDPDRRMLSEAQEAFLDASLEEPGVRWKVLVQQVMVQQWNAVGLPLVPGAPDSPLPVPFNEQGLVLNGDAWDGYTAQRDRLYATVREAAPNLVVLTGDVHVSFAGDLSEDPQNPLVYNPVTGDGAAGVEFVTMSVTSPGLVEGQPEAAQVLEAASMAANRHQKFAEMRSHGYTVLDLTPQRAHCDWYAVDSITEVSDGESSIGSWFSEADNPHLQQGEPSPEPGGAPPPPPLVPRVGEPVTRLFGSGRVETAVAVSQARFPTGVRSAYLATAGDFPDALAGGPAAALAGGPVLLSDTAGLPEVTADELVRLAPGRIVLLGGEAALAAQVEGDAGQIAPTQRMAGADRFATAAAVATAAFSSAVTVFVAAGGSFADALAGGAGAAVSGVPLLLTNRDALPQVTAEAVEGLGASVAVLLGGTAVIDEEVADALADLGVEVRLSRVLTGSPPPPRSRRSPSPTGCRPPTWQQARRSRTPLQRCRLPGPTVRRCCWSSGIGYPGPPPTR